MDIFVSKELFDKLLRLLQEKKLFIELSQKDGEYTWAGSENRLAARTPII